MSWMLMCSVSQACSSLLGDLSLKHVAPPRHSAACCCSFPWRRNMLDMMSFRICTTPGRTSSVQSCKMSPHRTFEDEASMLDQLFAGGRAYCMGSLNRADCWYLYAMSPGRLRYLPNAARHNLPHCLVSSHTF
ncbi:S-adenosylmethionine decarboxylase proenzyme [Chionoecetes opilio]|uniref:S-adenosylmethionine decarboxylase proenzyme n=1 Tax=Chionoecetes opilio TaxID=41210 RepID=A0A8J5CPA2_CHIOP|nr:S-adenosylmethionine decarboxylase proenzyme [Chionoecetes opilio]